jgi:hypothetical protein
MYVYSACSQQSLRRRWHVIYQLSQQSLERAAGMYYSRPGSMSVEAESHWKAAWHVSVYSACSQQSIEGCLSYYVYSACKSRYGEIVAVTGRAACMYSILWFVASSHRKGCPACILYSTCSQQSLERAT